MIYLDSNVIIRFIEGDPPARAPLEARLRSEKTLLASQMSRLECRVLPLRNGDRALLALYDAFFAASELVLIDLTVAVIDRATDLRARFDFRTPDSIHLACAIEGGATAFLTGDKQLSRCTDVAVEVL